MACSSNGTTISWISKLHVRTCTINPSCTCGVVQSPFRALDNTQRWRKTDPKAPGNTRVPTVSQVAIHKCCRLAVCFSLMPDAVLVVISSLPVMFHLQCVPRVWLDFQVELGVEKMRQFTEADRWGASFEQMRIVVHLKVPYRLNLLLQLGHEFETVVMRWTNKGYHFPPCWTCMVICWSNERMEKRRGVVVSLVYFDVRGPRFDFPPDLSQVNF